MSLIMGCPRCRPLRRKLGRTKDYIAELKAEVECHKHNHDTVLAEVEKLRIANSNARIMLIRLAINRDAYRSDDIRSALNRWGMTGDPLRAALANNTPVEED